MLALDATLVELLRGAWPNEWRIADIELLWTRLAASGGFRTALEYELGLRREAESVLSRAKYTWPGPPAGRRTRARRALAALAVSGLFALVGYFYLSYTPSTDADLAQRAAGPQDAPSAADQLDSALEKTSSTPRSAREVNLARVATQASRARSSAELAQESPATATSGPAAAPPTEPSLKHIEPETPRPSEEAPAKSPALEVPASETPAEQVPAEPPVALQRPEDLRNPKRNRRGGDPLPLKQRREHPLEIEASREADSLSLEIAGALAERQWTELQRTLASNTPGSLDGLIADLDDECLWISYGTMVEGLYRHQAGLRNLAQSELEPLARLRLSAALAAQDEKQVTAVAWHFYGTDAAAQAHLWLADRALTMGHFASARASYERAGVYASPTTRQNILARGRLAGAMLGTPTGKPVKTAVQLAGVKLSPIDFEAMVLTQQLTHQRRYVSPVLVGAQPVAPSIPVANADQRPFNLADWLAYDDLASTRRGGDAPTAEEQSFPELFSMAVGELTILGNALCLSAIDTRSAQVKWRKELTSARERHGLRALGPVTPVVADGRIYVRRWMREGTELLCLNLSSGDVLWQAELTPEERDRTLRGVMLTDPQIDGQRLTMLTATPDSSVVMRNRMRTEDLLWEVRLTEFSRQNGALLGERTLARLTGLTHVPRASRIAQAGRWRVAQLAGTALCLDATGELAWIRRLPWQEMEQFDARYRCAAVSDESVVCVWQPGGSTVECLDLASGRRHWQTPASQITRLVGIRQNRLLSVTTEGLEAFDIADGRSVWSRKLSWAARQAVLCGKADELMFAEALQTPEGHWRGQLFWLDATTGEIVASAALAGELPESNRATQPLIAPLAPHGNGLLAGYDAGLRRGQRRELLWITPPH